MLHRGSHLENHRSKMSMKQSSLEWEVGVYYRNNCVQLPKCTDLYLKHTWKTFTQPVCEYFQWQNSHYQQSSLLHSCACENVQPLNFLNIWCIKRSDGSWVTQDWTPRFLCVIASSEPLGTGLLLRAYFLRFFGVLFMPPIGYTLIRNRHRNPQMKI